MYMFRLGDVGEALKPTHLFRIDDEDEFLRAHSVRLVDNLKHSISSRFAHICGDLSVNKNEVDVGSREIQMRGLFMPIWTSTSSSLCG